MTRVTIHNSCLGFILQPNFFLDKLVNNNKNIMIKEEVSNNDSFLDKKKPAQTQINWFR